MTDAQGNKYKHYHGHGLGQIDDRSYQDFCRSSRWKDPAQNILMIALVLAEKRRFLHYQTLGLALTDQALEKAYIAAYNCGQGKVLQLLRMGRDPDEGTVHENYSRVVLRFAGVYNSISIQEVQSVPPVK
jgi:hypothetical protein